MMPGMGYRPRPTYAQISRALSESWTEQGEWAGIPMPVPGLTLTLTENYPHVAMIAEAEAIVHEDNMPGEIPSVACTEEDQRWHVVNTWYSRREQRTIAIVTDGTKYEVLRIDKHDYVRRLDFTFNTFKAYLAWDLETEFVATKKLRTLIAPHLYDAYILTGMFVETSPRSKLTYIFRRLRPTVVISWKAKQQVMCALCLHPIGYYAESFAGSMCPTDEVIAHLMLMRGDEHLYWKRAEQHQPWEPESGL